MKSALFTNNSVLQGPPTHLKRGEAKVYLENVQKTGEDGVLSADVSMSWVNSNGEYLHRVHCPAYGMHHPLSAAES